jgi:aldose 1-epimerase
MSVDGLLLASDRLKLTLAPRLGGAVTRFWLENAGADVELFRRTTPASLATFDPLGFSCFPLVPFSNRIAHGRFTFEDQSFEVAPNLLPHPHPLHGHGWRAAWRLVNAGASFAELELVHSGSDWPSTYRTVQRFVLSPTELRVRLTLENEGPRRMPAGIGLHPYFNRTPRCELAANVSGVWLANEDCLPREHVRVPDAWSFSSARRVDELELDHCFTGWDGKALLRWPEHDIALRIETAAPFDHLVVYVPRDRDFFCIEPVSHANDAVNLDARGIPDTGLRTLDPGESLAAEVRFVLE